MFPKELYVRIDTDNPDEPIIIAESSREEVMEGDDEQEIGVYKFVKAEKVRKVLRVS